MYRYTTSKQSGPHHVGDDPRGAAGCRRRRRHRPRVRPPDKAKYIMLATSSTRRRQDKMGGRATVAKAWCLLIHAEASLPLAQSLGESLCLLIHAKASLYARHVKTDVSVEDDIILKARGVTTRWMAWRPASHDVLTHPHQLTRRRGVGRPPPTSNSPLRRAGRPGRPKLFSTAPQGRPTVTIRCRLSHETRASQGGDRGQVLLIRARQCGYVGKYRLPRFLFRVTVTQ